MLWLFLSLLAPIPEKEIEVSFIRLKDNNLQTSVIHYEKDGKSVDLIGSIHIADKNYYEKKNNLFKDYDAVCFELVSVSNVGKINKEETFFDNMLKAYFNFEHQIKAVDYDAKNFVHADMSFDELAKKINENLVQIFMKFIQEMAKSKVEIDDVMLVDFSPLEIKRFMANHLAKNDMTEGIFNQILITDRNEKAMLVVQEQLKKHNKIAIYYGAAHCKDFDQRLKKLGFIPTKITWLTAWEIKKTPQDELLDTLRKLIK